MMCLCGTCAHCHRQTPNHCQTYCNDCSVLLVKCTYCGESIKSGNDYVTAIEEHLTKSIIRTREKMVMDIRPFTHGGVGYAGYDELYTLSTLVSQGERLLTESRERYKDKSVEEVLALITQ